ncbi:aminomethyl-transferring glycine dehydrogenase subunit GcvPB [Alphaproteobacteria bacterium]|nr:aminomethyl-transferring glycine dehydrogenase subunit GcvPB [Alphaproteobacteria bacterium]
MNDRSKAHSNSKNNLNEESVYKYSFKNNPISSYNELLFEIGENGRSGVDLPDFEVKENNLLDLYRSKEIGLPGLSEPQVIRHYVNLSRKNYSIDQGIYPLGSCTMKHNPRLNEKIARIKEFTDIHPLQPKSTVQGTLSLMHELSKWIIELTGMDSVAMSPAAGAHGELCGIMAIKASFKDKKEERNIILVPDSAHGTNPSTAAICGYEVKSVQSNSSGRIDLDDFKSKLSKNVAALMITNPNTCGLFENEILELSQCIHEVGGYLYCDGANFNAIVGKIRPIDLGIDVMHLNLHKTFSTPHGGGGPGSGPVVFCKHLSKYLPYPILSFNGIGSDLIENKNEIIGDEIPFGRLRSFHGQIGMFLRAYAYILSHGGDGLKQIAEDAVLNANYIGEKLKGKMSLRYKGPFMHEVLFDDNFLKDSEITTLDFAKGMINLGLHPMTIYFPLVASGAMLIEPTESESKKDLDKFCDKIFYLIDLVEQKNSSYFKNSPFNTSVRRLDETAAARNPKLVWGNN